MNKIIKYMAVGALAVSLSACEDLFEPAVENIKNSSQLETDSDYGDGILRTAYLLLQYPGSSTTDVATDDAVSNDIDNAYRTMAGGAWTSKTSVSSDKWRNCIAAIQYCNIMLDKVETGNWAADPMAQQMFINRLTGEAYGLRAIHNYFLLREYGGKTPDGQLLGFPLHNATFDPGADLNEPRSSYADCVNQIKEDVAKASELLPFSYGEVLRDNEVPEPYKSMGATAAQFTRVFGGHMFGRVCASIAEAVKVQTLLLAASPSFSDGSGVTWEEAADAAASFLAKNGGLAGISPEGHLWCTAAEIDKYPSQSEYHPEVVWRDNIGESNSLEGDNFPPSLYGNGRINPTQNLVDAFPMANGYPIDDPESRYDANDPYAGRDPRFYATVFHHRSEVVKSNGKVQYTFDMSTGGKDVANNPNNSPTNYYVRKFLYSEWNKSDITVQTAQRSVVFMRWTQMCLAFAEAANRVVGPLDATRFGYSARQAVGFLRSRTTVDGKPGLGAAADPYLDACAARGKEAFETLVRNERRIELCFEGERFFDLRRWAEDVAPLNGTVSRAVVGDGTYGREQVETRVFASRWLPIPSTEMRRSTKLVQNEGWAAWN